MADAQKEVESMIGYSQELSEALGSMTKAMLKNADTSKTWTVMSRFTSGSGFWKIQNKARGVLSSFLILNETMEAGAKAMAEYNQLLGTYNKIRKKVPRSASPAALKFPVNTLNTTLPKSENISITLPAITPNCVSILANLF